MRADINGTRAVAETDAMVLIREFIDGHLFDYCCQLRFYDLLEKRDGVWRLVKASCIYEKDRLDPVVPGAVPASFYEQVALDGERGRLRLHALPPDQEGPRGARRDRDRRLGSGASVAGRGRDLVGRWTTLRRYPEPLGAPFGRRASKDMATPGLEA